MSEYAMHPTTLADLLKDSAYKLGQFKPAQIGALEAAITVKDAAKRAVEIAIEQDETAAMAYLTGMESA